MSVRVPDLVVSVTLAALWGVSPLHAHGRLDQMNDLPGSSSFHCGDPGQSLFQGFTATESQLEAVALRLRAGGRFPAEGTTVGVRIRSGGPQGRILGSSAARVPGPQPTGAQVVVHFDFPTLRLTHGRTYIIEWLSPAPPGNPAGVVLGWMGRQDDPYTGGTAFGCAGTAREDGLDYNFNLYAGGGHTQPFPPRGDVATLIPYVRRSAPEILSFELVWLGSNGLESGRTVSLPFAPADGTLRGVDVELTPAHSRAERFRSVVVEQGGAREVPSTPVHTFHGRILGSHESTAVLSLKPRRGVEGYLMGPAGWSYVEPLAPLLVRLGLGPAEVQAALRIADHVVYSFADVVARAHDHQEHDLVSHILTGVPPPGEVQSTLSVGLWGVMGFGEQFATQAEAFDRMELVITMLDDVLSNVIPNHTDAGFGIDLVIASVATSPASEPCPMGTSAAAVVSSSVTCPHAFLGMPEPDLVHVFVGPTGPGGGYAFLRGLISTAHENHGVVEWSGSDASALQVSLHEMGHNIGATHGSSASDWGFTDDVFLVGNFSNGSPSDPSASRDDVIGGQLIGVGGYRWFQGIIRPSLHFDPDPSVYETVVNGPLDMMPPYLQHTSAAVPTVGAPGNVLLPGDFTGDGRYDLAYGIAVSPMVFQVAVHNTGDSKFAAPAFWGGAAATLADNFLVGDFDADGLDDVAIGTATGGSTVAWSVLVSTGSSFSLSPFAADAGDPGDQFFAGDVDADGDADLVILHSTAPSVVVPSVALSTGTAFLPATVFGFDVGGTDYTFRVADFNGDGTDDLAGGHAVGASSIEWLVSISDGAIFLPPAPWGTFLTSAASVFLPGDVDGDGTKDLIHAFMPAGRTDGPYRWFAHVSDGGSFAAAATLTRDVCITWGSFLGTPLQSCGTDIMLMRYGYGYDGRHVVTFSKNNALTIRATLLVFNAGP